MALKGFKGQGGRYTRDRSISDRDLLRLPIASITRNIDGDVTQIVRQGTSPEGDAIKVTIDYTYDVNGDITSEKRTYDGSGKTFVETETVTRNAEGDPVSTGIVVS